MYKTLELLDMVKEEYKLPSDYALAKKLNITRASISNFRKEKHYPSTSTAYNIAELLLLDPLTVVASIELQRAKHFNDEQMINLWKGALEK